MAIPKDKLSLFDAIISTSCLPVMIICYITGFEVGFYITGAVSLVVGVVGLYNINRNN